jgi:hypothetical protein
MTPKENTKDRRTKCIYKTLKWNFGAHESKTYCLFQTRFVSAVECCRECAAYKEEE